MTAIPAWIALARIDQGLANSSRCAHSTVTGKPIQASQTTRSAVLAWIAIARIDISLTSLACCAESTITDEASRYVVLHTHAASTRSSVTGLDSDFTSSAGVVRWTGTGVVGAVNVLAESAQTAWG